MSHIMTHPENGMEIIKAEDIGDRCFSGKGWSKYEQKINDVTVHYMARVNGDGIMTDVTDFKFK
ncbi:hypothetical protein AWB80_01159 [Caballeronia pedi]|uniref:Uncharacterized protein n=1 Tax=Caballeronia pedi TaxID=1777141 RepID=A0A157ZQW3_9BURK|nr:hypothetical protein AWB80_01159 [Caballeronia pedi]